MYREIVVRVFGEEAVNRVDRLRQMGVDFTDLVHAAIMAQEVGESNNSTFSLN